jgi:outer membrane lipoprotein
MSVLRPSRLLLVSSILLAGCASDIPPEISSKPENSPTVSMARGGMESFVGSSVRWGGLIATVENHETTTRVEIVARDLNKSGRPLDSDFSPGRFIAVLDGFVDPAVYSLKREITVYGVLEEAVDQLIGEYTYNYPVVTASNHVLWKPISRQDPNMYPPYWYDPWYGPYRWGLYGHGHHHY